MMSPGPCPRWSMLPALLLPLLLSAAEWQPDAELQRKLDRFLAQVPGSRSPDLQWWPEGRQVVDHDVELLDRMASHAIHLFNRQKRGDHLPRRLDVNVSSVQFSQVVLWYRQKPGAVAVTLRRLADPATPILLTPYGEWDRGPAHYALRHRAKGSLPDLDEQWRAVLPSERLDPLIPLQIALLEREADDDQPLAELLAAILHEERPAHAALDRCWRIAAIFLGWQQALAAGETDQVDACRAAIAAWADKVLGDRDAGIGYRVFMAGWIAQQVTRLCGSPAADPQILGPAQALRALEDLGALAELHQVLRLPAWLPLIDAAIAADGEPDWQPVMDRFLDRQVELRVCAQDGCGRGFDDRGAGPPRRDDDLLTLRWRLLDVARRVEREDRVQWLLAADDCALLRASGTWAWLARNADAAGLDALFTEHWRSIERADCGASLTMLEPGDIDRVVAAIGDPDLAYLYRCLLAALPDRPLPLREQQEHARLTSRSPGAGDRSRRLEPLVASFAARSFATPGARIRCLGFLLSDEPSDAGLRPTIAAAADHFGIAGWRELRDQPWLAQVVRWCLRDRIAWAVADGEAAVLPPLFHSVEGITKVNLDSFIEDIGRVAVDPAVQAGWSDQQWRGLLDTCWQLQRWDGTRKRGASLDQWRWLVPCAILAGAWEPLDAWMAGRSRRDRGRLDLERERCLAALVAFTAVDAVRGRRALEAWLVADNPHLRLRPADLVVAQEQGLFGSERLRSLLEARVGAEEGRAAAELARLTEDPAVRLAWWDRALELAGKKKPKRWRRDRDDLARRLQRQQQAAEQDRDPPAADKPRDPPAPRLPPEVPSADGF